MRGIQRTALSRSISIHDLPRRSTIVLCRTDDRELNFNPRPPEEVDEIGRYYESAIRNFNPRPPEEVDDYRNFELVREE